MSLIKSLQWRYATKKMNGQAVPEETVNEILDITRLAASSYGLQPFTILVIKDQAIKEKLLPAAYGQTQIVDSSHLLVFAVWASITEKNIDDYVQQIAEERGQSVDMLAGFKGMMTGGLLGLTVEQQQVWSAKQAYIALGTALAAAAEKEVDSTPMEGFNNSQFDEILGLKEQGLASVAIMPLGYRSEEDQLAKASKVRRNKELLFKYL